MRGEESFLGECVGGGYGNSGNWRRQDFFTTEFVAATVKDKEKIIMEMGLGRWI